MRFVGSWLNQLAAVRSFPIQTQFLFGNDVTLSPDSEISQALLHGAAVVLRLFLEVPHYVLLTGISRDEVFFFDPYYEEEGTPEFDAEYYAKGIRFIYDQPKCAMTIECSQSVHSIVFIFRCHRSLPAHGHWGH